jgi:hypothetical protein
MAKRRETTNDEEKRTHQLRKLQESVLSGKLNSRVSLGGGGGDVMDLRDSQGAIYKERGSCTHRLHPVMPSSLV